MQKVWKVLKDKSMDKKIKLYLFTGFLGSGKTTLLKGLLNITPGGKNETSAKTGVIVNEFGKINVDGAVLEKDGLEMVEINNGSIFCKCLEGTFIKHVAAFADMPVEYLFIESSGLADPANMESIIKYVNRITEDAFSYEGTICVVDASNFLKLYSSLDTIQRQINFSNLIIVNKTDLVDQTVLERVTEKIREINPITEIIQTSYCRLNEDIFKKDIKEFKKLEPAESLNTRFNRPPVLVLKTSNIIDRESLVSFANEIKERVFRVKGFAKLQDGLYRFDVAGDEAALEPTELTKDNSEIVIISKPGYNVQFIKRSCFNHIGQDVIIQ